jgi:Mlc titration factor MtfA (ptsG expression regulator)
MATTPNLETHQNIFEKREITIMIKIIFIILIILIIVLIWLVPVITKYKRSKIGRQNFPTYWLNILEKNVYLYRILPHYLRQKLHRYILVFLAEKQFIGCGGLDITTEIKITIAAQACLLLLSNRSNYYPYLDSILVYPSIFVVKRNQPFEEYYLEEKQILSGESWGKHGLIVLAWDQVQNEAKNHHHGHNVVIHEFAHQLDREDGSINGVPKLKTNAEYQAWAEVFSQAYQQLCNDLERGNKSVINAYGATNTAEFFAVASETYFTKPQALKNKYPQLYEQLKNYYQVEILNYE